MATATATAPVVTSRSNAKIVFFAVFFALTVLAVYDKDARVSIPHRRLLGTLHLSLLLHRLLLLESALCSRATSDVVVAARNRALVLWQKKRSRQARFVPPKRRLGHKTQFLESGTRGCRKSAFPRMPSHNSSVFSAAIVKISRYSATMRQEFRILGSSDFRFSGLVDRKLLNFQALSFAF